MIAMSNFLKSRPMRPHVVGQPTAAKRDRSPGCLRETYAFCSCTHHLSRYYIRKTPIHGRMLPVNSIYLLRTVLPLVTSNIIMVTSDSMGYGYRMGATRQPTAERGLRTPSKALARPKILPFARTHQIELLVFSPHHNSTTCISIDSNNRYSADQASSRRNMRVWTSYWLNPNHPELLSPTNLSRPQALTSLSLRIFLILLNGLVIPRKPQLRCHLPCYTHHKCISSLMILFIALIKVAKGVPTPVPPTFEINGTCYMRTTSTGSLLLGVHDKLSGAWVQVRLFEDLDQASLERSGADTTLVAPYTLSNIGVSGMETHHIIHQVEHPQPLSLDAQTQGDFYQTTTLGSAPSAIQSNLSGTLIPDSYTASSYNIDICSIPSQLQSDPPFHLKSYASKVDIDNYCAQLTHRGSRDVFCPFCRGSQDRVSNLKRHLYFRFRIKVYECTKGCGQKFSTADNEKRHSKKCEGFAKCHLSRPKRHWIPHCQISTRMRPGS